MILYEILTSLLVLLMLDGVFAAPHIPRFTSHVSFLTPSGGYSHGVGDAIPRFNSRLLYGNYGAKPFKRQRYGGLRSFQSLPVKSSSNFHGGSTFEGYPREKPLIPFNYPSLTQGNSLSSQSSFNSEGHFGHANSYTIPALPASPYKVDSPDAESLWPEGLLVRPSVPYHQATKNDKIPSHGHFSDTFGNSLDPYLLEGIEAVQALERIIAHGELFHHEIPHEQSLLANQRLRVANGLVPNRLGSIRPTSSWFRV